jgi:hypothetical protein
MGRLFGRGGPACRLQSAKRTLVLELDPRRALPSGTASIFGLLGINTRYGTSTVEGPHAVVPSDPARRRHISSLYAGTT